MVKQRFIRAVQKIMSKASLKEIVIILDAYTINLISNLFSVSELVGIGITIIERLDLKRKPLEMQALYFV